MLLNINKNFIILLNTMRFKMNVVTYIVAIFAVVGISGLLYTSSFLPSTFAQNASDSANTGSQQQNSSQSDIGTIGELQNLTQGNQQMLANNTSISNSSLSSGLELEQDTDQPATNSTTETDEQKLGHNPQGQVGPSLEQSAQSQNQTGQGQQSQNQTGQGQQSQNQTGQGQQSQNQTGQGPLDQLLKPLGSLLGGNK
jgi:hypothetical protein